MLRSCSVIKGLVVGGGAIGHDELRLGLGSMARLIGLLRFNKLSKQWNRDETIWGDRWQLLTKTKPNGSSIDLARKS
jgi:hypothetical protein